MGVSEILDETAFLIYPNPTSDLLYINLPQFEQEAGKEVVISIYNLDGRQLMSMVSGVAEQVAVSFLESGVYLLSVRTHERTYFGKFIKN